MSWGAELWDQYDHVCHHAEQGIEFVKRVSQFVEKRISIELSYAKELRRLVKGFKRKEEEESKYTALKGFSKLVHESDDLAGQRELIAEYMQADVLDPLKTLARDITAERKKHMRSGTECQRQLKATMEMLDSRKKQFERASEEAENAHHALEKADVDPNSTKAKIDKLTITLRQKESTAEECRNNYILQLEATNADRRQHYMSNMPQVFKDLHDMNANRITKYKELMAKYAECHRKVFPIINTCLDNITAASAFIDPAKDNQQLIDDRKTGFAIPGDVEFEEYQGRHNKQKPKARRPPKEEPKEDFSHLPPERQRKKLKSKVDELDAAIVKAESDRTAMEKMRSVYAQNPSLGDAKAVANSLEHTNAKLSELAAERDKFQGWLTQASESKLAPPKNKSEKTGKSSPKTKKHKDKVNNSDAKPPPSSVSPPKPASAVASSRGEGGEWFSDDDGADQEDGDGREGVILYDFNGQNEEELSVKANTNVTILEDLGDGWLRVKKGADEGYVPSTYVQIKE